jgi:hypothetical protein
MSEQHGEPPAKFVARTGHEDDELVVYDEEEYANTDDEDRIAWRERLEGRGR